jgi:hypothetical protein
MAIEKRRGDREARKLFWLVRDFRIVRRQCRAGDGFGLASHNRHRAILRLSPGSNTDQHRKLPFQELSRN